MELTTGVLSEVEATSEGRALRWPLFPFIHNPSRSIRTLDETHVSFSSLSCSVMKIATLLTSFIATIKSLWVDGSPLAGATALWPTDESGKYVIQLEGIRLASTNHGALANLWINDTNGNEIDIVLGFDNAKDYLNYNGNTYLGGAISQYRVISLQRTEGCAGAISGASFQLDLVIANTHPPSETKTHDHLQVIFHLAHQKYLAAQRPQSKPTVFGGHGLWSTSKSPPTEAQRLPTRRFSIYDCDLPLSAQPWIRVCCNNSQSPGLGLWLSSGMYCLTARCKISSSSCAMA